MNTKRMTRLRSRAQNQRRAGSDDNNANNVDNIVPAPPVVPSHLNEAVTTSHSSDDDDDNFIVYNRMDIKNRPSHYQQKTRTSAPRRRLSITKKRTYRMVRRVARPVKESNRLLRWKDVNVEEILSTVCCKRKCFNEANKEFLIDRIVFYRSLPRQRRLNVLYTMTSSTGSFIFDGKEVCSKFLTKAFRFSTDIQRKVKNQNQNQTEVNQFSSSINDACTSSSSLRHSIQDQTSHTSHCADLNPIATPLQKDAIIIFLDRIVDDVAEMMPDCLELHLPFFRKEDVHSLFLRDFSKIYPTQQPPSLSYFYEVWQSYRFNVKVRKQPRFTKCSTCERLRSSLADALLKNQPTDQIKKEQLQHLEFVSAERREYMRKIELAILRPAKYLSVVIDGADQHAFALPHFVTKTKDQRGHGMKVHLIGALSHAADKVLRLYTMTDEHCTGSNHIVETLHRFIADVATNGDLPRNLFLQLDNCVRENKNKYLMAYLDALVHWQVFDCVEVGFLPVGHTHSDIDQCFSTTSDRLTYHNAITMEDLHRELQKCYNEHTKVSRMTKIVNWSALCDTTKCINSINLITQYRFFKIMLSDRDSTEANEVRQTACLVRSLCTEDWHPLENDSGRGVISFLKFLPDLLSAPPEVVRPPEEENEIDLRIDSEKSRIDRHKLKSIMELKASVFRNKSIPFHWNLETSPEFMKGDIRRPGGAQLASSRGDSGDGIQDNDPVNEQMNYDYEIGSMVIVNTGKDNLADSFWVAKVTDVLPDTDGVVRKITVHWYEFYNMVEGNVFNAMFRPSLLLNDEETARDVMWIGSIDTNTIMVSFNHLTSDKRLPSKLQTYLREYVAGKKLSKS